MLRKLWLSVACLALGAPLLAAPATAQAAAKEPGYGVTPLKFTVPTGKSGGTSCGVDADLYRPRGVDAGHPAPAVLTTNGFGGSKNDDGTARTAAELAGRGYVVLAYSGLGFGKSGCRITLDDPRTDGKAASALVDFLGGGRAADDGTRADFVTLDGRRDPRVGMIGGSYGGAVQLATAAVDHRVDAIVPMITWNDLTYSLVPNNTDQTHGVTSPTPGAYKWQWTNGFYLLGQIQGLKELGTDPDRASVGCVNFPRQMCRTKRMLDSGRFPAGETQRALRRIRDASPVSYLSRVKAPTLLIQGEHDTLFNLDEATATYRTLRKQGTTARMVWQDSGHSGHDADEPQTGDVGLAGTYPGRRALDWFAHYLRGERSAPAGPAFAYFRDWSGKPGGSDGVYATSSRFPVGERRRLYLSGDGTLAGSRDGVRRGSRGYRNWRLLPSSYSESSLLNAAGLALRAPHDARGTHLSWTTGPLKGAVDVVGSAKARLRVVSPDAERTQGDAGRGGDATGNLVLFAKVYDVAPDGKEELASRLVAPARVKDARKPFTVTLPAVAHRYRPGHRLRFTVAAGDAAYYGNRGVKHVALTGAPGHTGTLDLPVAGGAVGERAP